MPGAPLALHEREEIFRALIEDPAACWASVARRVRRHASTVAREVARGGGRGRYGAATAQRRADRCRSRPRRRRLEAPGPLRDQIASDLRLGRSPEAIRADLAAGGAAAPPCTETIYQALYSGALGLRATKCLRSRRQRLERQDDHAIQINQPQGAHLARLHIAVTTRITRRSESVGAFTTLESRSGAPGIFVLLHPAQHLLPLGRLRGAGRILSPR